MYLEQHWCHTKEQHERLFAIVCNFFTDSKGDTFLYVILVVQSH